jgi:hypothetical protein
MGYEPSPSLPLRACGWRAVRALPCATSNAMTFYPDSAGAGRVAHFILDRDIDYIYTGLRLRL